MLAWMGSSLQLAPWHGPDALNLEPVQPCLRYTACVLSPDQSSLLAHVPHKEAGMLHPDASLGYS